MAVTCEDGTVVLWDLARRTREGTLRHGDRAKDDISVAFSADGKLLASGGADGRIVLWDVATRTKKGAAIEAYSPVFSIAVSHDGKTIASGHQNGGFISGTLKPASGSER